MTESVADESLLEASVQQCAHTCVPHQCPCHGSWEPFLETGEAAGPAEVLSAAPAPASARARTDGLASAQAPNRPQDNFRLSVEGSARAHARSIRVSLWQLVE